MARNDWSNQSRFSGWSGAICMALTLALSVASVTVVAQTAFDFEDPLDEVRSKIERAAPAEAEAEAPLASPTPVSSADRRAVVTPEVDAKGPITVFAERLGLPTAGLVGLGLLGLLGLLFGLMWLFGRRKAAKTVKRKDRELYAVANGTRGRRTLESGAKVSRNRKQTLDTAEGAELAAPSAAAAAARVLSGEENHDTALTPAFVEVDEQIFADDALSNAYQSAAEKETNAEPAPNPDDPSTWKRPNLDRLKQSIRDDWKGDKAESAEIAEPAPEAVSTARNEADTFADLFGDEDAATESRPASKRPVIDILDDFDDGRSPMSVAALRDAVEKTVDGAGTTTRAAAPRPALPSRADAVRRIKALRESVKAS